MLHAMSLRLSGLSGETLSPHETEETSGARHRTFAVLPMMGDI